MRRRRAARDAGPRPECRRDQAGTALVELTWLGVLLLVPMLWIALSVFDVQRGALGVTGAARAAGRAYALAPDDPTGQSRAEQTARQALDDQGVHGVSVVVHATCTPFPDDCHAGTSVVTVEVSTAVDLPLLPSVFGHQAPTVALAAHHVVPIGQYQETSR